MKFTDEQRSPRQNWSAFTALFSARHCLKEMISAEFDSFRYHGNTVQPFPVMSDVIVYILVLSGRMEIRIDNKVYHCSAEANNVVTVKPMNALQALWISQEFKGYILCLEMKYLISQGFRPQFIPINQTFRMRSISTFTLNLPELQYLFSIGQKIERNFSRDAFCVEDLIYLSVMEFHLEILVMALDRFKAIASHYAKSRKSELCIKFAELVFRHCHERHEVAFYAGQLCVTPQYLARVFRETVGLGAKAAIDHALVSSASVLLRSNRSLQQVADELHFSDQSSFGKFFKKHTGMSPARFRESNK